MDCARAHAVTLWCAVLGKAQRGLAQLAPKDVPLVQFRLLVQFSLPGCERLGRLDVARALVLKPDDADAILEVMKEGGLVEKVASGSCYEATESGRRLASGFVSRLDEFFFSCVGSLSDQEAAVAGALMRSALLVPGGFHEGRDVLAGADESRWPPLCLLAFSTVFQVLTTASKRATGLSFTDFRFLLELYPKKRHGCKTHRAKDMVRFLRTGRAYVTTASVRLEDQGYISRIPDENDARGVLFQLEPAGYLCVQDAIEDVWAVLVAFYGDACGGRVVLGTIKKLLVAEDAALGRMAVG